MQKLIAVLFICLFAGQFCLAAGPEAVLIVHDDLEPMEALAGMLREKGAYSVEIVPHEQLTEIENNYAAVFMYVHDPLLPAAEKVLIGFANQGGRLIILHHGLASAKLKNPAWLALAGLTISPRNDPKTPWRVKHDTTHTMVNLNPGHFITTNQINYERTVRLPGTKTDRSAFDLKDTEIFQNQQHTDSSRKVILFGLALERPHGTEIQPTAGWYKPLPNGMLFYFQAGHEASDFQNPNYAQVLLNALVWQPEK